MCCQTLCVTPKIQAGIGGVFAVMLIAMVLFCFSATGNAMDLLNCFVTYAALFMQLTGNLTQQQVDEMVGGMQQVGDLFKLLALAPGAVTFICLALCAGGTYMKNKGVTTCFVCLGIFFGLVTIVCAFVVMLVGDQLLPQLDQATAGEDGIGMLTRLREACEILLPQLKIMIDELKALNEAYPGFLEIGLIDYFQQILDALEQMCECFMALPDALATMAASAVLVAVASFCSEVSFCSMCSSVKAAAKTAPGA